MIPRGAERLIVMRLEGWRPKNNVWLTYGDFREPGRSTDRTKPIVFTDWRKWDVSWDSPDLLIRPEDNIERMDLRCIAGLRTVFFFLELDRHASRLYERLQGYSPEITVLSPYFGDDLGWIWTREVGERNFVMVK